ncbi:MAG: hypothetical protein JJU41_12635 [Bacteroidetes bacterium]|nr:hypothetical protein [Bacteroidota bacterium]
MKLTDRQNSALRHPITSILGSKGHIEVIRAMVMSGNPISHSELLDRTSISRQGVYDIAGRLLETGVIEHVGVGRGQLLELRKEFPLTQVIKDLFVAEAERFENILGELRSIISSLEEQPDSAWIFGTAARFADSYGDPIQIALVGKLRSVDTVVNTLREFIVLNQIEKRFDLTLDVVGLTMADLEVKPDYFTNEIIHLWGISPKDLMSTDEDRAGKITSHQQFDKRSYIYAKAWTALLRAHPSIIPKTILFLNKEIDQTTTGEKKELMEWKNLLENSSFQRLKKVIESDSEKSVRLRQSMPFWNVLREEEIAKFERLKLQLETNE